MKRHTDSSGKRWITLITGIAAAFAAAFLLLWGSGILIRVHSPWSVWEKAKTEEGYAAGSVYRIELKNRRIQVFSAPAAPEKDTTGPEKGITGSGKDTAGPEEDITGQKADGGQELALCWNSPDKLRVQDFLWCDIDSDGIRELMLLCWYIGDVMPWESGQPVLFGKQWGQHVYIYKPYEGSIHQEWLASRIYMNIAFWEFDEIQRLFYTDETGTVTRWDWYGWGLQYWGDGYPEIRFLATGDNLIHEKILRQGEMTGDYGFLYEHIAEEIRAADISILSQETVFVRENSGIPFSGYPFFATPTAVGEAALEAGFDAAACATNHALDCGETGLRDTLEFYREKKTPCLGIGDGTELPYEIFRVNGLTAAILNYTYGTNIPAAESAEYHVHRLEDEETVRNELLEAKRNSDIVLVLVHWGTEYSTEPDAFQEKWKTVFLDCGVDAVVGTHPHVLQKTECLSSGEHRMLVYNSLGNLVSRQDQPGRILGGLAEFSVQWTPHGNRICGGRLVPVVTHQTAEETTVYLLADYTEELAAHHRLGIRKEDLIRLLP